MLACASVSNSNAHDPVTVACFKHHIKLKSIQINVDTSRSATCPSLPGCMICIGPVLHVGSIFSSSGAAARRMGRSWESFCLQLEGITGVWGSSEVSRYTTWSTRWGIEFLATLRWKKEKNMVCQGSLYYEVIPGPPARAEPLKMMGPRGRNPHPFTKFPWLLGLKDFLVRFSIWAIPVTFWDLWSWRTQMVLEAVRKKQAQ